MLLFDLYSGGTYTVLKSTNFYMTLLRGSICLACGQGAVRPQGAVTVKKIVGPVIALSVVMLILMAGSSAVSPILPQYARDFGVSITIVGLVLAVNNSMRMLLGFPAGVITDRWGRKPFITAGMLITAAGALVSWSASKVEMLFIGQALVGIGAALYATAALSMVVDLADETNRSKATGLYMMGYHLGTVFGPGVGGWLAYRYGANSPFLMFSILAAMAAIAAIFLTRETHPPQRVVASHRVEPADTLRVNLAGVAPRPAGTGLRPAGTGLRLREVLTRNLSITYLINFAFRFGFNGLMWTILPLMIADLGLDSRVTGFIFMTLGGLSMLFFFPSGVLADRLGRRTVMLPGAVMGALAFLIFRWANTLPWIIAASAFLGISGGFISTIPAALVGDFAPEEIRGTAMGVYRSIGDLGLALSPAILGFVGDHFGLPATFLVTFGPWSLTTLSMLLLPNGLPATTAPQGQAKVATS
jgi:DHA1 family multidrug resistance protein-like MFS transporter